MKRPMFDTNVVTGTPDDLEYVDDLEQWADEAEALLSRAVGAIETLIDLGPIEDDDRWTMNQARQVVADIRETIGTHISTNEDGGRDD